MLLTAELQELKASVEKIARGYGLDFFTQIFELVDYDQINEIAAFGGFPTRYPHWRFGMEYERLIKTHTYGMGKIYELVINNDPCYAYLLRSNSMTEHKLVMAHVYGHNDFFKNNTWFSKTNRKMMDQMANHGTRIRRYYDRHGQTKVENFIDACLSIEDLIDPFAPFVEKKPGPAATQNSEKEETRVEVPRFKAKRHMESYINPPQFIEKELERIKEEHSRKKRFPEQPEKDVLKFLMEHAPLEAWQRDILQIIRNEAYYFVPQRQTKIMNEGWASYWHSRIMTRDLLADAEIVDYADVHSGTMGTRPGVINPYKIGMELFRHIEQRWDTGRFGPDWDNCTDLKKRAAWDRKTGQGRKKVFDVRRIYNDVTFIDEFLDAEFAERQKLFVYGFDRRSGQHVILDRDYTKVKDKLLFSLTNFGLPYIQITDANWDNRGELYLLHQHFGFDLDVNWAKDVLRNVCLIWGRPVHIETVVEGAPKRVSYDGTTHTEAFVKGE